MSEKTKEQLIASLHSYEATMRSLIIEANIKPSQIQIPSDTDRLTITELEEGVEWIKKVFENEFKACRETKKLLPEEQWSHYRQMDMDGTIEMKELKGRLRNLRQAIINKNRPRVFRKTNAKK